MCKTDAASYHDLLRIGSPNMLLVLARKIRRSGKRIRGSKILWQSSLMCLQFLPNVKEHATLSAGASVDHGGEVKTTGEHVNRAADRGCCVSSCSDSSLHWRYKVKCGDVVHYGPVAADTIEEASAKAINRHQGGYLLHIAPCLRKNQYPQSQSKSNHAPQNHHE